MVFAITLSTNNGTLIYRSSDQGDMDRCVRAAEYVIARIDPKPGTKLEWGCRPIILHLQPVH